METFISGFLLLPQKRSDLCSMAVSKRDDEASTIAAVPHICQKVKAAITPSSSNQPICHHEYKTTMLFIIKRISVVVGTKTQWKKQNKTKKKLKLKISIFCLSYLKVVNAVHSKV